MQSHFLHRAVHICRCPDCQRGLRNGIIEEHRAINLLLSILDEKRRRLFAGFWAMVYGRGGIERLAVITGLSRTTIRRGRREFLHPENIDPSRIRKPGGGRKRIEKKTSRHRGRVGSIAPGCNRRRSDDGPEVDAEINPEAPSRLAAARNPHQPGDRGSIAPPAEVFPPNQSETPGRDR